MNVMNVMNVMDVMNINNEMDKNNEMDVMDSLLTFERNQSNNVTFKNQLIGKIKTDKLNILKTKNKDSKEKYTMIYILDEEYKQKNQRLTYWLYISLISVISLSITFIVYVYRLYRMNFI